MKNNNEIKSSAHSKYRCQYHIVFAPKYRRQEIYGKIKSKYKVKLSNQIEATKFFKLVKALLVYIKYSPVFNKYSVSPGLKSTYFWTL